MKRLSYDYIAGERILAPFSIDPRRITVSQDLPASLATLFPIKAVFFSQKNPEIFAVSFLPTTPYGPAIHTLIDFFFSDFQRAVAEVKDFFGLQRIDLISPDNHFKDEGKHWSAQITKRHETGILVTLFEFYQLYMAAIHHQDLEHVLLSIFVDEHTIFCLHVPEGIPLQNIFLLLQTEYYLELTSENTPFHPLLRKALDPEHETTGPHTALIMFTHSGYTIGPTGTMFLPFPYFDHTIGIRQGEIVEKRAVPCNRCLSCVEYCPSGLCPHVLYHKSLTGRKEKTSALNIKACIQCGLCNFVCPANLPLCETITQTIHDMKNT